MHKGLKKDRIIYINSPRVCNFAVTMFPVTSLSIRIPFINGFRLTMDSANAQTPLNLFQLIWKTHSLSKK